MQEAEPNDASMLIPMNFTTLTSCWFNLRDNTKSNKGSNSNKWSLTEIKRQSGPITTGAPSPSTTATTVLPSSSSPAASATASTIASASSGDGFSAGAKAGLGIGVGIGTALICAGAFWLYYRHVKRKEHHQEVYRRIVGGHEGAAGQGQDAYTTPHEHLEPWRYGNTPQPAPSATVSAYSGASDNSTDWYQSQVTVSAPYQYYDPVASSYHVPAGQQQQQHYPPPPPSVLTTASMSAEPPSSIIRDLSSPRSDHVPEAAAIRDVRDLNSTLYPSEFNEPVSPVSADREAPPARVASVNYGPTGRLDASTGADFALLPDYTSPTGGGGQRQDHDDLYGPPTPRTPPPPHSAHARAADQDLPPRPQPQPQELPSQQPAQEHAWYPGAGAAVAELPTAQTHHRGYGPQAELPADEGPRPALRQQRSDLRGPEQKVLLRDVAPLRAGQDRDGG